MRILIVNIEGQIKLFIRLFIFKSLISQKLLASSYRLNHKKVAKLIISL